MASGGCVASMLYRITSGPMASGWSNDEAAAESRKP